jgi:hypothetical protein
MLLNLVSGLIAEENGGCYIPPDSAPRQRNASKGNQLARIAVAVYQNDWRDPRAFAHGAKALTI